MIKDFKMIFEPEIPKYIQIARYIKALIDNKEINEGEKLPTIRNLSTILNVNNVTIVNAYKKLVSDGYANQKVGSGTYAKRKEVISTFNKDYLRTIKRISDKDSIDIIDFSGENSKESTFPIDNFKDVINKVLDRDGANALLGKETLGFSGLRETINKFFWENKIDLNNILIVSGAQQGIDIASKAIVNINDNVIVEKPTYGGAVSVFKWRKANIFEVDIENDGINLEKFEKILKKNKISCFYTMSYFHNPTGVSYSLEKKLKLLYLAKKYDFYIIEDDYLSELIYDEKMKYQTLKSLDEFDRVIYIRSFSKVFLPGIRLGYMITPTSFKDIMYTSKLNTDISTSTLMQRALDLYIKEGYSKDYISNKIREFKEKYIFMKECIDNILLDYVTYIDPRGGLYFYIKLKDNSILSKDLFYKLRSKNVYITPGAIFLKDYKLEDDFFRISFLGVSKEKIEVGIRLIKEALE